MYPIIISDVDISFFLNKVLHCVFVTFFSCQVQGSDLMEREKKNPDYQAD